MLLLSLQPALAWALTDWHDRNRLYENTIYDSDYRTVQFYKGEWEMNFPTLTMQQTSRLTLEFDKLGDEAPDLAIRIIHCNADWRPSELIAVQYLEGMETYPIRDVTVARTVLQPFVHYQIQLPQPGMRFKKSGNYAIIVYKDDGSDTPVLVRRLPVMESGFSIVTDLGLAQGGAATRFRLQQLNFEVLFNNVQVIDPAKQIKTTILQNFNWHTAVTNLNPQFFAHGKAIYAYDASNNFPAGNEFRLIDLRSTRLRPNPRMTNISFSDSGTTVFLEVNRPRSFNFYQSELDFNGGFFIDNREYNDADLESDYLSVRFRLAMSEFQDGSEVYVYGGLSDWELLPRTKMFYDQQSRMYQTEVLLKQGIYDYKYVVRRPDGTMDEAAIEGDFFETENAYTILVYHRGFADRFDRLLGMRHINFYER
ncbi:MAG: type IX secretion system plug protein domain-containing protein [Bacteroidota bacterium]